MRLIDADALLQEMVGITDGRLKPPKDWKWYEDSVRNAPTVAKDINVPDKWVSVKDRLPDAAGYECLVCAVNTNYNQTHVFTAHTGYGEPGWWTGNVNYMSKATSPYDNRLHPALKVTHWMPLPEPPKEDEE